VQQIINILYIFKNKVFLWTGGWLLTEVLYTSRLGSIPSPSTCSQVK